MVLASTATGGLRKAHEAMLAGTPKMPSHPNGTPCVVSVDPTVIGRFVDVTATCPGSRSASTGVWSPPTTGPGLAGGPSPTPPTSPAANVLRRSSTSHPVP